MNRRLSSEDDPSILKPRRHTSTRNISQRQANHDRGMSIPSCLVGIRCWPSNHQHERKEEIGKITHIVLWYADWSVVNAAWKCFSVTLFSAEIVIITIIMQPQMEWVGIWEQTRNLIRYWSKLECHPALSFWKKPDTLSNLSKIEAAPARCARHWSPRLPVVMSERMDEAFLQGYFGSRES